MKTSNIVNFPVRLPSAKNISSKELSNHLRRTDLVSIQVGDQYELQIPSYVIEQRKDVLNNISRQQKRKVKRVVKENLEWFSKFMKSKNKLFPAGFSTIEEILETIHVDAIINECFKQIETNNL